MVQLVQVSKNESLVSCEPDLKAIKVFDLLIFHPLLPGQVERHINIIFATVHVFSNDTGVGAVALKIKHCLKFIIVPQGFSISKHRLHTLILLAGSSVDLSLVLEDFHSTAVGEHISESWFEVITALVVVSLVLDEESSKVTNTSSKHKDVVRYEAFSLRIL